MAEYFKIAEDDPDEFNAMYVKHFKSYDDKSPTRPGDKFGDALDKLIDFTNDNPDLFNDTIGLDGFRRLKSEDYFPGLGQIKKLSIQHHIETLSKYRE
ncbi:sce7725 family protein [Vibrio parahaemolyticus]|nr:sce7725 family protein [Vibrio parahaemolyticus]